MDTRWMVTLGTIIVFLFVVASLHGAEAQDSKKGTTTLQEDEYYAFETDKVNDDVPITFEFDTDNSVPIDAYIFDETNFNRYRTGGLAVAEKSVEDSDSGKAKYYTEGDGVYYVVFDNSDYGPADPQGSVTVHYEVTLDEDPPGLENYLICGAIIIGFVVLIAIKMKLKKRRREKEELKRVAERMGSDPDFAIGAGAVPVSTPPPDTFEGVVCSNCGNPATYIEQYGRHYCYDCREYVDTEADGDDGPAGVSCSECGNEADYIEQYDRYYCYDCKVYVD